jgi:probable DNA metabolism protein
MKQFARFARMPEGVYVATINPKHSVVPLVMEHFAGRFNVQSFILYDEVHHLAGVSQQGQWLLCPTDEFHLPQVSTDERQWQRLWKTFYDSVAIDERRNEELRRHFMPKRLWRNITEMNMVSS